MTRLGAEGTASSGAGFAFQKALLRLGCHSGASIWLVSYAQWEWLGVRYTHHEQ